MKKKKSNLGKLMEEYCGQSKLDLIGNKIYPWRACSNTEVKELDRFYGKYIAKKQKL